MKCKICGYQAMDISHMAAHYRKKHPRSIKRTKKISKGSSQPKGRYCPTCGKKI